MRRNYQLRLIINGKLINQVTIDSHYEAKHSKSINDYLILELIKGLNGRTYAAESISSEGWEIYVNDPLFLGEKPYRLVWCLHPDEDSVGVINAFRRSNAKVSK
jgi:hypothetical protein